MAEQLELGAERWGGIWVPRRWQSEALPEVLAALDAGRRTVVAAATGSGKSILIAELAARHTDAGAVLVTVPTVRLVTQTARTIAQRCPGRVGVYYGKKKQGAAPIVVACADSVPSLIAEWAIHNRRPYLWIWDECHRGGHRGALVDGIESSNPQRLLGLSATPFRAAEREKLVCFDGVCFRYTLGDALRDRVIVPWHAQPWSGGEMELDRACITMIRKHGVGPGIVNASSIEDAEAFADKLTSAGIDAEAVHSRRSDDDNDRAILALREGHLRCIVHVSMLSEGVDYPWLRWLAMRRLVGARTRIWQEIGRVIRACKGKDRATLLDLHDLVGTFGLHMEAAIGAWTRAATSGNTEASEERATTAAEERFAVHTDPITAYCRRVLLPLQAEGWVPAGKIRSVLWRRASASQAAVGFLRGQMAVKPWRWLPGEHSDTVLSILKHRRGLSAGAVSDLIEISKALRKHRSYPLDAGDVMLPTPEDMLSLRDGKLVATEDPRWYVAGVWRKGGDVAALAAFHSGRIIRTERINRPDTWAELQLMAVLLAQRLAGGEEIRVAMDYGTPLAMLTGRTRPNTDAERRLVAEVRCGIEGVRRDQNPASPYGFRKLARKK